MSDSELKKQLNIAGKEIARYKNMQLARKVQL